MGIMSVACAALSPLKNMEARKPFLENNNARVVRGGLDA